jgi:hypothetical protein
MTRVVKFGAAVVCTLSVVAACGKKQATPSSPSTAEQVSAEANSDGSTLKASAPTLQSPINGVRLEGFDHVVLTIGNASASYLPNTPLSYRFELTRGGTLVETAVVGSGPGTTSYTIVAELEGEVTYEWRARAEYHGTAQAAAQGTAGPWATKAAFVAPQTAGYMKGAELYDPLINGTTIGTVVGPVTFIPGVGARLESFESRIVYELPEPLEDGEFSALITNVATNTEGGKTKVFSMSQGYGDQTVNPRRMTVEKRGDGPTGGIAFRFLTSDGDGVDTVGPERVVREFDPSKVYFWEADWRDGFFNLRIDEGGVGARNIYNFGKPYGGFYRAEPHVIYLGSGPARGGPSSMTVPGMVIRQVWVSQRARPAFANK